MEEKKKMKKKMKSSVQIKSEILIYSLGFLSSLYFISRAFGRGFFSWKRTTAQIKSEAPSDIKSEISSDIKSEIPWDIIFEICSWLPVKSLYRFKCVSRFHNSLVSDASFLDIHQSNSIYCPDKTKFLARSSDRKFFYTIDLKVKRIKELDGYNGFASAKGLFCFWNKLQQPPVIYNPTTRKMTYLPYLHIADKTTRPYYSIGFEPYNKEYKILIIKTFPVRCWIFTLGSSESWREITRATRRLLFIPLFPLSRSNGGVCVDGVFYFFGVFFTKLCIMALNVRIEEFRFISLWEEIRWPLGVKNFYYLIELEGKWAAVDQSRVNIGEMDLWILERSKKWVKCTIAFPLALSSSLQYLVSCSCSGTPYGEILLIANFSFKTNWIFLYDLKKKSWRSETKVMEIEEKTEIVGIHRHVDSLLSCIYC